MVGIGLCAIADQLDDGARDHRHRQLGRGPNPDLIEAHPSSIALSLLAYGATFDTTSRSNVPIEDLHGDGSDPTRDHLLPAGEMLTAVTLPPPASGEQSAYVRLMSRARAEWPLVECVVRLVTRDGTIGEARVCTGAVANIPLRLPEVEAALTGRAPTADTLAEAGATQPTVQTRWSRRATSCP